MKKVLLTVALATLVLMACNKDGKIEIPFSFNKEFKLHVIIPTGIAQDTAIVDETIPPTAELQEYLEKIKSFNVKSANFRLANLTGGDGANCMLAADFEVSLAEQLLFSKIVAAASDPKSLKELVDLGEQTVDFPNTDVLLELLKTGGTIHKKVIVSSDNANAENYEFDIILKVNTDVIVEK